MNSALLEARHLRLKGKLQEAYALLQEARRNDPLDPDLWYEQAKIFEIAGEYETAEKQLAMYVTFHTGSPIPYIRLGFVRYRLGRVDDAIDAYQTLLTHHPEYAPALSALGTLALERGERVAGEEYLRRALAAPPIDKESVNVQAVIRLLFGDYQAGFAALARHWGMHDVASLPPWRQDPDSLWDGHDLDGRPLVVHAEEGLGDVLMLLRFVPRLAEFGGPIYLDLPKPVRRLAAQLPNVAGVLDKAEDAPAGAMHVGLLLVPSVSPLQHTVEVLSPTMPYLKVSEGAMAPPPTKKLRVGLAWTGGPATTHDRDRSVPRFSLLEPLLSVPDITWQSLQLGPRSHEIDGTAVAPLPPVDDFLDTARIVNDLDLVISVDTSVAHLAGAMAKPVWIFVPTTPEWRWGFDRAETPWYPSARLFRRSRSDAWVDVIDEVRRALVSLVEERAR